MESCMDMHICKSCSMSSACTDDLKLKTCCSTPQAIHLLLSGLSCTALSLACKCPVADKSCSDSVKGFILVSWVSSCLLNDLSFTKMLLIPRLLQYCPGSPGYSITSVRAQLHRLADWWWAWSQKSTFDLQLGLSKIKADFAELNVPEGTPSQMGWFHSRGFYALKQTECVQALQNATDCQNQSCASTDSEAATDWWIIILKIQSQKPRSPRRLFANRPSAISWPAN